MRAREFIIESLVQKDSDYRLPTLNKHRYTAIDQLVRKQKHQQKITNKAAQNLDEEISDELLKEVNKATNWFCKKLNISDIPTIELSMDQKEAQHNHHTGGHIPGSGKIWVYAKNRNLVDILRTVFHELVHVRQGQLGMIKPNSSYPGSPIEVMADMLAGKWIKIYGEQNHHIFQ